MRQTGMYAVIAAVLLVCLTWWGVCGPVGSTSQWGIVVAPCAWCGATNDIEVHHIYPQHLWPERARDTNNMVCLCRRCHFVLGHRCCWTNAVTNLMRIIELK
jgi:hypothetical protein